jgi:hypothetical protein
MSLAHDSTSVSDSVTGDDSIRLCSNFGPASSGHRQSLETQEAMILRQPATSIEDLSDREALGGGQLGVRF